MIEKLRKIIEQSSSENIRILIEVEPSGLIHVYCDSKNKRKILRMIRKTKITCSIKWYITTPKWIYNEKQSLIFLKENKGRIALKF